MPSGYRDTSARFKVGPVTNWRDAAARFRLAISQVKNRDVARGRFLLQRYQLAIQSVLLSGLTVEYIAAHAGGMAFTNDGRVQLLARNVGGSARTLTFVAQRVCDQGVLHDQVVTIPASTTVPIPIGTFPVARFNDARQQVQFSVDNTSGLTVAAVSPS